MSARLESLPNRNHSISIAQPVVSKDKGIAVYIKPPHGRKRKTEENRGGKKDDDD